MANVHQPVLLDTVIEYLNPKPNGNFVDCTLGGGGHAAAILEKTQPYGKLLGIDLDSLAINLTQEATKKFGQRIILVQDNFKNLINILQQHEFGQADGILLDLGLSSNQLVDKKRGFSFTSQQSLDMRFGGGAEENAQDILNKADLETLVKIFKEYGQEKLASPIAKLIVSQRKDASIENAEQLAELVARVYKKYYRRPSKMNPATKVFQALRIAVNDELNSLKLVLPQCLEVLKSGGRLAVISYHSLEDKIVKDFIRRESKNCICPPSFPACQCDHKKQIAIINKKPIEPSETEIGNNPRARSAKLRIIEKI